MPQVGEWPGGLLGPATFWKGPAWQLMSHVLCSGDVSRGSLAGAMVVGAAGLPPLHRGRTKGEGQEHRDPAPGGKGYGLLGLAPGPQRWGGRGGGNGGVWTGAVYMLSALSFLAWRQAQPLEAESPR